MIKKKNLLKLILIKDFTLFLYSFLNQIYITKKDFKNGGIVLFIFVGLHSKEPSIFYEILFLIHLKKGKRYTYTVFFIPKIIKGGELYKVISIFFYMGIRKKPRSILLDIALHFS